LLNLFALSARNPDLRADGCGNQPGIGGWLPQPSDRAYGDRGFPALLADRFRQRQLPNPVGV